MNKSTDTGKTVTPEAGLLEEAAPFLGMLQKWNTELAGFYLARIQQYAVLPQALMGCRDPEDISKLQKQFFNQLVDDYRIEADTLSRIAMSGATDGEELASYSAEILKAQADAQNILEQARAQAEKIIADAEAATTGDKAEKQKSTKAA